MAAATGTDDASDAVYADGWGNGDNGGTGFGPWTLAGDPGAGAAGFFTAGTGVNSQLNHIHTGPNGNAWGLYANGDGANAAAGFRPLAGGALAVGQSFSLYLENRYLAAGGTLGFTLRSGNATDDAQAYAAGARFHWFFLGGSNNYFLADGTSGGAQFDTGVPWTENGLRLDFSLKTVTTYDLEVVRLGSGGGSWTLAGRTLAGSGNIGSLAAYAQDVDVGGEDGNAYFNALAVSQTSLIGNGHFERHAGGWNTWSNWTCDGSSGTLEQGYRRSPVSCARTWHHDTRLYQDFAANPDVEYTADASLFTPTGDRYAWDAGSNTYACVRLEFKDAGNGDVGTAESAPFTPNDAADAWSYRSVTQTAPSNTAYGRLVLSIRGASPGGGTVAFDDASVLASPPAGYALLPTVFDAGGGRATNDRPLAVDSSIGGPGGVVSTNIPPGTQMAKHGYAGQLYDLAGLDVSAVPPTINEGGVRTIEARPRFDDGTTGPMDGSPAWSIVSGPLRSVAPSGPTTADATASNLYQNTPAVVRAERDGLSGDGHLTVLNINFDDFGSYSNDGIEDGWQVTHFGLDSPLAAPGANPDGDWPDNLYEFITGTDPNDSNDFFSVWIAEGAPYMPMAVVMDPTFADRTYDVQHTPHLPGSAWDSLPDGMVTTSGTERTVGDPGSTNRFRAYRVEVTYPW